MQVKDSNKKRRDVFILAGVCILLQLVLAPYVVVGNGHPNFALVCAGVLALSIGGREAVIGGFAAGLLFDLTSSSPIGLMAMLITVFSYVLGIEERNRFGDGFVSTLSSFGVGSLCVLLAYHMTMLLLGDASNFSDVLMMSAVPSFALTFLGFLPFAYRQVHKAEKRHGITGGASSTHRGGQHYDVSNL